MLSPSIPLLLDADAIQSPYQPLCEVSLSCGGGGAGWGWLPSHKTWSQKPFISLTIIYLTLQVLILRCSVASLTVSYHFFLNSYFSSELVYYMLHILPRPHCTRFSTYAHFYSVHLTNGRQSLFSTFHLFYGLTLKHCQLHCFITFQRLSLIKKWVIKTCLELNWSSLLGAL